MLSKDLNGISKSAILRVSFYLIVALTLTACTSGVQNAAGIPTHDIDPNLRGPVAGVGIEGHDLNAMADKMVRDMLQSPILAGAATPPQVVVDAEYIRNESSQQINKNMIADRLRASLASNAQGRMVFVSAESMAMVAQQRALKRSGTVDVGTIGLTRAVAGVDYQLRGRIASLDSFSSRAGNQRSTQIEFEMIDMERGTIVWSNIYTIDRAAMDDVVYR